MVESVHHRFNVAAQHASGQSRSLYKQNEATYMKAKKIMRQASKENLFDSEVDPSLIKRTQALRQ